MNILGDLLVIAVLILLNAIFVAAEIALVTLRPTRVEQLVEERRRGARRVARLTANPGHFLAVIQVGITFIGFLASAFAALSLTVALGDALEVIAPVAPYAGFLALLIVTALVSLFTIVFGELVPKTLALSHAERFALVLSGPVDLVGRLLGPLVWFLTKVTNAVSRLLGADPSKRETLSTEELKLMVERGTEQGILEAEEEQMISAVIELGERRVHEVMVPRVDVVALPVDTTVDVVVDTIIRAGHSRVPLYEGTVDQIVGIVYAKDLLPYLKSSDQPRPTIRELMREPVFVPESRSVDDLLHEFQRSKVHMAVVIDEYGGTAGVVTIEDLIEEIVGEIQDEFDLTEEPMVEKLSDDEVRVDGRVSVDDLAEIFDLELNGVDSDEYDTVGGLVYHYAGRIPHTGDVVTVDGLTLTVESTDGRRVGKVLAVRRREDEQVGAEGAGE